MVFIRAKNIKGKKYAYLVENNLKSGKVIQKVKKYLGLIVELNEEVLGDSKFQKDFDWNISLKYVFREVISDMFERMGFIRKNWTLTKEDLTINLSKYKIFKGDKNVVLLLNGRYLTGKSFSEIENFVPSTSEEDLKGMRLAKLFSDNGVFIDKDTFIQLYRKIYL